MSDGVDSPATVPREALVIRFRPTDPAKVLESADKERRRTGRARLSVFADTPRPGESEADLRRRLLAAAELSHVNLANNRKYFVCAEAGELLDRGFLFYKDGDDDEADEHYSVDLGEDPRDSEVKNFLAAFSRTERMS